MKTLYLLGYLLVKLLIALPVCWWVIMSGFGLWRCIDLLEPAGECAALVALMPLLAALPSIGDSEDSWAFRLTVLSVPTIAAILVLVWEFGLPLRKRSQHQANRDH
jgi:hypothetical protein